MVCVELVAKDKVRKSPLRVPTFSLTPKMQMDKSLRIYATDKSIAPVVNCVNFHLNILNHSNPLIYMYVRGTCMAPTGVEPNLVSGKYLRCCGVSLSPLS